MQVTHNLRARSVKRSLEEEETDSSRTEELERVRVWVSYEIWQEKEVKMKHTPASTLRRRTSKEVPKATYQKSTSSTKGSPDIHYFEVDPKNTSPEEFKHLGMIEIDHYISNLSTYLLDPTPPKNLMWFASERTPKRVGVVFDIEKDNEWNDFIDMIQEPLGGTHYISLMLKMPDPSLVRQAEDKNETQQEALRTYQKKKIDASARPNRKEIEIPEPGAPNERAMLIQSIIHAHQNGDHSQCEDPSNKSNFFRVTLDRARVWADIMVSWIERRV